MSLVYSTSESVVSRVLSLPSLVAPLAVAAVTYYKSRRAIPDNQYHDLFYRGNLEAPLFRSASSLMFAFSILMLFTYNAVGSRALQDNRDKLLVIDMAVKCFFAGLSGYMTRFVCYLFRFRDEYVAGMPDALGARVKSQINNEIHTFTCVILVSICGLLSARILPYLCAMQLAIAMKRDAQTHVLQLRSAIVHVPEVSYAYLVPEFKRLGCILVGFVSVLAACRSIGQVPSEFYHVSRIIVFAVLIYIWYETGIDVMSRMEGYVETVVAHRGDIPSFGVVMRFLVSAGIGLFWGNIPWVVAGLLVILLTVLFPTAGFDMSGNAEQFIVYFRNLGEKSIFVINIVVSAISLCYLGLSCTTSVSWAMLSAVFDYFVSIVFAFEIGYGVWFAIVSLVILSRKPTIAKIMTPEEFAVINGPLLNFLPSMSGLVFERFNMHICLLRLVFYAWPKAYEQIFLANMEEREMALSLVSLLFIGLSGWILYLVGVRSNALILVGGLGDAFNFGNFLFMMGCWTYRSMTVALDFFLEAYRGPNTRVWRLPAEPLTELRKMPE